MSSSSKERIYACIDLKTFYASVECVDRNLDPFNTRLVVADPTRSDTTICLAISPAMKALGIRNRCRLHEIPDDVDYIVAMPRMKRYMEKSAEICSIYLRYVSPDDIHVYSIDECFIDLTPYLELYGKDPKELSKMLMEAVFAQTGICATAGIGTNLLLAKLALDITAKHAPDNIGFLDAETFRATLWTHRPLTDIWGFGPGITRRLARFHVYDLKGITQLDPDIMYGEFGANAEYLIDHAWGYEPCTIAQIKAYEPEGHSMGNGQVLPCDYSFDDARLILKEMVDASVLDLIDKKLATDHISLFIGYSWTNSDEGDSRNEIIFEGEHGKVRRRPGDNCLSTSRKLPTPTYSYNELWRYFSELYDEKADPKRSIRKLNIALGGLCDQDFAELDLFTDQRELEKETRRQQAILAIKDKFGKNSLFKGMNLREKSTGLERNKYVGGHRG